jgi:Ni2+-binding GTPase involved in maturation of urease and hydrogenase
MSVLKYTDDFDEDMKTEVEATSNVTIMEQPPKIRVAVCGPAKSGKTFLLHEIEQRYLEQFENPLVTYFHMNTAFSNDSIFTFTNNMVATETRDFMTVCTDSKDKYKSCLRERLNAENDSDLILIEDVRHPWEFEIIYEFGFTVVYADTADQIRFKRAKDLTEVNFMWSQHERQLGNLSSENNEDYIPIFGRKSLNPYRARVDIVHCTALDKKEVLWDKLIAKLKLTI